MTPVAYRRLWLRRLWLRRNGIISADDDGKVGATCPRTGRSVRRAASTVVKWSRLGMRLNPRPDWRHDVSYWWGEIERRRRELLKDL